MYCFSSEFKYGPAASSEIFQTRLLTDKQNSCVAKVYFQDHFHPLQGDSVKNINTVLVLNVCSQSD